MHLLSGSSSPLHDIAADFNWRIDMKKLSKTLLTSTIWVSLLAGGNFANAVSLLPPIQHSGANSYVTGGIGLDESTALKSAMKDWPLSLQFAEKDGQRALYVANAQVVATDAKGQVAIGAKSEGPFMLAKIPVGVYKIEATLAGKTLRQQVEIKEGLPAKVTFLWPAGTGETR